MFNHKKKENIGHIMRKEKYELFQLIVQGRIKGQTFHNYYI